MKRINIILIVILVILILIMSGIILKNNIDINKTVSNLNNEVNKLQTNVDTLQNKVDTIANDRNNIPNSVSSNTTSNISKSTNSTTTNNRNVDLDKYTELDKIEDGYIDIWRDISDDPDFCLESIGTGENRKLYLGAKPVHYLININGEVYTYQDSSFENIMTGERDPATVKHIKKLSQSDLKELENDLKLVIDNYSSSSWTDDIWYIKIDNSSGRVDVDLETQILNKYFLTN